MVANARWSLDFVHDQLANGRRFRILNIIDDVTKECLAHARQTDAEQQLRGVQAVEVNIPRQSRGLYGVSRSKRLDWDADAAQRMGTT